ncbi:hypothetical protein CIW52_05550 [Mycolicibacterium sp. P9-64]|nr:hypothetical protein CIW52_05550 [Mycolicibacterium sp. P9-64]
MTDASTEPLMVPVGLALREPQSRAEAVVTALAQAESPRTSHASRRRRLLPLILVSAVVVATSVAVVLGMADRDATTPGSTFRVASGDCLTWPPGAPDRPAVVDCRGDHLFEVADAVEIDTLADTSGADPATHLQRSFRELCPPAVSRYLGSRFDPDGRFGVGMVWSPTGPDPQSGGQLLCGLQLSHPGASSTFQGRVRDLDQSAIWSAGTCLGILDGNVTDVPVDCASPHAMEITGAVSLADVFTGPPPATAAQDGVVRGGCGAVTDAYLSPLSLAATSLTVRYTPIAAVSWDAGSRQIACRLASPTADGRWATLVGSAKTGVTIDGRQPAAVGGGDTPPTADQATAPAAAPVQPPQDSEPADEPAPQPEPGPSAEAPGPPDEGAPPPELVG